MAARSDIGAELIRDWARTLPPGAAVLDIGCGAGEPITRELVAARLQVSAMDASPTLCAAFASRYPDIPLKCERVEASDFFGTTFDAVVMIGVMFLLDADTQLAVIERVAEALNVNGRFLFTAPWQACEWTDVLTGRTSRSLGREGYVEALGATGLSLLAEHVDDAGNHYFEAVLQSGLR